MFNPINFPFHSTVNGLFQKIIVYPSVEYIDVNFQGGCRVKVVGIPGIMSKFEGKTRISKGFNAKSGKLSG